MTQSWVGNKTATGLIISVMIKVSFFRVPVLSFMPELSALTSNLRGHLRVSCFV